MQAQNQDLPVLLLHSDCWTGGWKGRSRCSLWKKTVATNARGTKRWRVVDDWWGHNGITWYHMYFIISPSFGCVFIERHWEKGIYIYIFTWFWSFCHTNLVRRWPYLLCRVDSSLWMRLYWRSYTGVGYFISGVQFPFFCSFFSKVHSLRMRTTYPCYSGTRARRMESLPLPSRCLRWIGLIQTQRSKFGIGHHSKCEHIQPYGQVIYII